MDSGTGLKTIDIEELNEIKAFQGSPLYKLFERIFKQKIVDLGYKVASTAVSTLNGEKAMFAFGELYGRKHELDWILNLPTSAENEINRRGEENNKKKKTLKVSGNFIS